MAGFSIKSPKGGPKPPTSVSMPKASNVNRDRTTLLRPPRLKPLSVGTRDYAKAEAKTETPQGYGAGFGQTGLTGET